MAQFLEATKSMTPDQRAERLRNAMDMAIANDAIAEEGESQVSFCTVFNLIENSTLINVYAFEFDSNGNQFFLN